MVIAFQKSRSSCNWRLSPGSGAIVIAFQKSRSSCNQHDSLIFDAIVIAFQKSRSSCNFFATSMRSEEHTSELQSLMRNSYAVLCLNKKTNNKKSNTTTISSSYITYNKYLTIKTSL